MSEVKVLSTVTSRVKILWPDIRPRHTFDDLVGYRPMEQTR